MSRWSGGYVSDVAYTSGFYVEQTPSHLQLSCLLNAVEPPALGASFRYCELGCGHGATAAVIAAANPHAHVVAIDFNPAHIARARDVAARAGLSNVEFLELSFAELALHPELAEFDVVTLHGVWSWIADEDRRDIAAFLARAVKPGGLAAVSYNAMPGWASMLPLQRVLFDRARAGLGRSDRRVLDAIAFVRRLQQCGCTCVGNAAILDDLLAGTEVAGGDQAVYLAHEYLNANWQPLYHADTTRLLAEAKLTFAGSATLTDDLSRLRFKPEQLALLDEACPGPDRETLKDFLVPQPFRRDVFVRGLRPLSEDGRDRALDAVGIALLRPPHAVRMEAELPAGKVPLPRHHYVPIVEALAVRPRTARELAALPELRKHDDAPSAGEIAAVLVGTGQALPLPAGPDATALSAPSARRYNRVALRPVVEGAAATAGVAVAGSGATFGTMSALVLAALLDGAPAEPAELCRTIEAWCGGRDALFMADGQRLEGADAMRAGIAESVKHYLADCLPLWAFLGLGA